MLRIHDWDEPGGHDDDLDPDREDELIGPPAVKRGWGPAGAALRAGFALGAAVCGWILY
ncbi:MAG: hypothetical protein HYZ29_34515 [Myxococcales bacterium]|nr:hypothetical protein [Myxococcales bacterium]